MIVLGILVSIAAIGTMCWLLFNLAVALERIHQPRPALKYYERALARADGNAVMFDPAIARQRIEAITTAQGN